VEAARRLLGIEPAIGVSVHSAAEAVEARGADFLLVGTLFETPSHPDREGAGTGLLREVSQAAMGTPLVGIGGITAERVPELRRAGSHGFAVLRGVWEARAPARAVERYLTTWHGGG
jgi:thiamine-phosphate diphosphorylase